MTVLRRDKGIIIKQREQRGNKENKKKFYPTTWKTLTQLGTRNNNQTKKTKGKQKKQKEGTYWKKRVRVKKNLFFC